MLVTVLCLTYMMVIILIHAIWITSIIKHDGKCHYHNAVRMTAAVRCRRTRKRERG